MPSRAWVVTADMTALEARVKFQCPHGLELLHTLDETVVANMAFQCPHGLELLRRKNNTTFRHWRFQCPHGLELLHFYGAKGQVLTDVSMPSRAWVVTWRDLLRRSYSSSFNALTGLSCYFWAIPSTPTEQVSMPSRAWVVTPASSYEWQIFIVSMPSRAWVVTWVDVLIV